MSVNPTIFSGKVIGARRAMGDYSAIVKIQETDVWAEDEYGRTIDEGEAGIHDAKVIQSAIDTVNAQGGGIVKLKTGKYLIDTKITVPELVRLSGEWRNAVVIDFRGSAECFELQKLAGLEHIDISFENNPYSTGKGILVKGGANRTKIREVWISGYNKCSVGIEFYADTASINGGWVENVQMSNVLDKGIHLHREASYFTQIIKIVNCEIYGKLGSPQGYGIYLEPGAINNFIDNVSLAGWEEPLYCDGNYNIISNPWIDGGNTYQRVRFGINSLGNTICNLSKPIDILDEGTDNHILVAAYEKEIVIPFTVQAGQTDKFVARIVGGLKKYKYFIDAIALCLENAPGLGESVSVKVTDGTNTMTATVGDLSLNKVETSGAFEWDAKTTNLEIYYSSTATATGGNATVVIKYHEV
jgi:hypothetical protein